MNTIQLNLLFTIELHVLTVLHGDGVESLQELQYVVYSTGRGVVTPRDVPLTQDLTRPRLRVGAGLGMKGILEIIYTGLVKIH